MIELDSNKCLQWNNKRLSEVCDIILGQSPPSTHYNNEGVGLPFLQGKTDFTEIFPIPKTYCSKPLKIARKGSILFSVRAPVGDVNIADRDYIIGRGLASLILKEGYKLFLFYSLLYYKANIEALASGSTFESVNKTVLENFIIPLPLFSEQKAIAKILRNVQEAKEARRREIALERELKSALMECLFTHGISGEQRKQTEIGEIPQSWVLKKLGDIATIDSGGTPDRTKSEYWNGDIPWVKTGEINYCTIVQTEEKITGKGLENSSARLIMANTLLMAMYGQGVTRGRVAILGIDATINQACAAIHVSKAVSTKFLYYFLEYNYEKIRTLGHGANQTNLNAALIKSILVSLTSISEQEEISRILSVCDDKIATLERETELLDELFRAMLEQFMTGQLSAVPLIEDNEEAIP